MKTWSIKKKLFLLSGCLLGIISIVGLASLRTTKELSKNLDNAIKNDLPAVRHITLADMMHDGLRAIVYRSLYISDLNDLEQKKEVAQELKDVSEELRSHLDVIAKLEIDAETSEALEKSKLQVESYIKASEEISLLALSNKKDLAVSKIKNFQAAFEALEKDLEKLGDLIEKDAEESNVIASHDAKQSQIVSLSLAAFGLIFGSLLAWWITQDLTKTLANVIGQLSRSSHQVSNASSGSASSATELSEASTEQAASLQETMASVEEISAMVSQNAESAEKVKNAVDTNQKVSEEGARSVTNMLRAIDEIKSTNDKILGQMETSNKEFSEIVKIISEIGDKTKVINDIVFQTKLLSFNASVEAARAGEHGKGFAVVAEEVGNLAQMSGNAAKEITDMLSSSIKRVHEIVDETTRQVDQLVEVGKDKISMGQSTAQKCQEALNKISENARMVASMVAEITNASKEQAQGVQEINKAISQLDQVTQQNSSVAQRSSAQAEELNTEAQTLSHAVDTLASFVNGGGSTIETLNSNRQQITHLPVATVTQLQSNKTIKSNLSAPVKKKKAVNSPVVPDSDDPNFEEF